MPAGTMGIPRSHSPWPLFVGAHNEQKGAHYPHHHPRFNIDEDAMPTAVEVVARAAMNFLT